MGFYEDMYRENHRKWMEAAKERDTYRAALDRIFKEVTYTAWYDASELLSVIDDVQRELDAEREGD